jgi:hypothetical protein
MGARTARLESGRAQLESSMRSLTRPRSPPRARPPRQARRTLARPGQAGRAASARNCRARSDERASGPSPGRGNCLGSADATPARETPQAGTRPSPDAPAGRALRRCPDTTSTSASRAHAALSDQVAVASASCSGDRLPQALRAKLALHSVPPPSRRATRALLLAQRSTRTPRMGMPGAVEARPSETSAKMPTNGRRVLTVACRTYGRSRLLG